MVITRSTHTVRVTNPNNTTLWVDVEVLDQVAFIGPNSEEFMYDLRADSAIPYVLDDTGDGGATIGDPATCSRKSHMTRLVGIDDTTQILDVEVLDAIAFKGPNNAEFVLKMPQTSIKEAVIDNTGSGFGVPATATTTRVVHIAEISERTDGTTSNTDDSGQSPSAPATGRIIIVKRVDAIAFVGPNKSEWLMLIPKRAASNKDTTAYKMDTNGNRVPPENTDPNPYIRWPQTSAGQWVSGAHVPPKPDAPIVAQGPFWWIGHSQAQTIGVLQFSYTLAGPTDVPFLAKLTSQGFGLSAQDLSTLEPITLPPKPAGGGYWVYAPQISNTLARAGETYTVIDNATYDINTNLGKIVSGDGHLGTEYRYANGTLVDMAIPFFGFEVPLSTADVAILAAGGGVAGYLVDLFSYARNGMVTATLTVHTILASHTVTVTETTYTKTGNIIVFFDLHASQTAPLTLILDTTGAPFTTSEAWTAKLSTYKTTNSFPVGANNDLPPDLGAPDDPIDFKIVSSSNAESVLPSYQTTFTIDTTTLRVTASKEATS